MDDLLRAHARSELGPEHPTCRTAWRILLGVRTDPAMLKRWWHEHGEGCERCAENVRRVAGDHTGAAVLFGLPRVLRLPRARETLAWAASTGQDLMDPRAPLPEVAFHRLGSDLGPGLSAVWCVGCDGRLLLILCGESAALKAWERGAQLRRTDGGGEVTLVPAGTKASSAFCPRGALLDAPAICLEAKEPQSLLLGCQISMPGLVRGEFRLDALEDAGGQGPLDDLLRLNRAAPFLRTVSEPPPSAEERATQEFYLGLLTRQGRIPERERERLRGISWISDGLRSLLAGGA